MKFKFIVIALLTGLSTYTYSQNSNQSESSGTKPYETGFLQSYGVGAKLGTYGYGVDFYTSLHPNLKARVGFSYMGYKYDDAIDIDADLYDSGGNISLDFKDANLKFPNGNILVDYFPVRAGIFHLTGGFFLGQNKITATGHSPNGSDKIVIDDYIIQPNPNGDFAITAKVGDVIKPYLGFGLGRTITNSRVGFKFELGVIYQGDFTLESPNMDTKDMLTGVYDSDVPKVLTKVWPMINFSLSYRIK